MLAGWQKEEAKTLTLLDDESRAVLGLLQRGAASAAVPPPVQPLRPSYQSDMTNRPSKVFRALAEEHAFSSNHFLHFLLMLN